MKRFLPLFFILLMPLSCFSATFSRTLVVGSQGADVKELQVLLNSDPYTRITESGPGSFGNETTYFGALTKLAVMNFQKKYSPEVLFPAGLYQPTGIVGTYSRAKLNTLNDANQLNVSVPVTSTASSSSTVKFSPELKAGSDVYTKLTTKNAPLFFNLSRYEAKHGQSVKINGSGFLPKGNNVYFGNEYHVDDVSSAGGDSLQFTVPDSVPNGSYNLFVKNQNGDTHNESYGEFFTITDSPSEVPVVTAVTPSSIAYGSKISIVISGSGFAKTGNDIYSGFGTAKDFDSSDGKTITVPLSSFSNYGQAGSYANLLKTSNITIPVFVAVYNKAGISNTNVTFLLHY